MGIGLPAFSKMVKGNGITIASRNISGKINAAISYAAMKRCYVAIVFPMSDSGSIPLSLRYTSYRVAEVYNNSGTYTFINWIDGENWEKMPSGTAFCNKANTTTFTFDGVSPVVGCDFEDVNNTSTATNTTIANCIIMTPAGMLSTTTPASFGLWEASVTGTSSLVCTNASNHVTITVNPFTGRLSYSN